MPPKKNWFGIFRDVLISSGKGKREKESAIAWIIYSILYIYIYYIISNFKSLSLVLRYNCPLTVWSLAQANCSILDKQMGCGRGIQSSWSPGTLYRSGTHWYNMVQQMTRANQSSTQNFSIPFQKWLGLNHEKCSLTSYTQLRLCISRHMLLCQGLAFVL